MKIEISRRAFIGGVASVVAVAASAGPVQALERVVPSLPKPRKWFPFPKEFEVVVKLITPEGNVISDTIAKARLVESGLLFDVPTMNAVASGVIDHILIENEEGWIAKVQPGGDFAIAWGDTIDVREIEARWV